jgi:hypothetical protein
MRLLLAGASLLLLAAVVCFVLGLAQGSQGLLWAAVATGLLAVASATPALLRPARGRDQRTGTAPT